MVTGPLPFPAVMAPSSESKMKRPGLPSTATPVPAMFATMPVGVDFPVLAAAAGTVNDPTFMPLALYNVVMPELLSAIQNGLVGKKAIPHGLTRFGSTFAAT